MPRLTGFSRVPIPGPPPTPLLGHLPKILQFLDDPIAGFLAMRAHGDVVAVSRDSPALVCVFGAERNRDVLGNPTLFQNDEQFLQGEPGTALGRLSRVIINLNGEAHRRHRKLMMPAFTRAAVEAYAPHVVAVTERVVVRWPLGEVADLDVLTRDLSLCVAMQTLFGLDVLSGATELGEVAAEFVHRLASPLAIVAPYRVPGSPYWRANRSGDRFLAQLEALVARKRAATEPGDDALALLLRAFDAEDGSFTDEELLSEVATLHIAGHETTAKALLWTLFLLERHPAVLAELLDEVDGVLGGRTVTLEDIPRLPLLDRVVKESLRVLSPVPMVFLRVPVEETTLGSVRLPRGANVVVSPFATHREPEVFPEPGRFLPDRWSTIKPSPYEYLPFGAGPRTCVGAGLAQMTLRLMVPTILQRARWTTVRDHDVSRLTRANILGARHGVRVQLQPAHRERLELSPIRGDIGQIVQLER